MMKKNMNRLATLALSGMMVLSTAAPVFASSTSVNKTDPNLNVYYGKDEANVGVNTNAGGKLEALGNSVSFDKVIRVETDNGEMVDQPDVVWEYTVAGVTNNQKINVGGASESAAFEVGKTKIVDKNNQEMIVLAGQASQIDETTSDLKAEFKANNFELTGATLKDFTDGVKISFKPAAFATPGVYRFVVTEGAATGANSGDVEAMKVTVDNVQKFSYPQEKIRNIKCTQTYPQIKKS